MIERTLAFFLQLILLFFSNCTDGLTDISTFDFKLGKLERYQPYANLGNINSTQTFTVSAGTLAKVSRSFFNCKLNCLDRMQVSILLFFNIHIEDFHLHYESSGKSNIWQIESKQPKSKSTGCPPPKKATCLTDCNFAFSTSKLLNDGSF